MVDLSEPSTSQQQSQGRRTRSRDVLFISNPYYGPAATPRADLGDVAGDRCPFRTCPRPDDQLGPQDSRMYQNHMNRHHYSNNYVPAKKLCSECRWVADKDIDGHLQSRKAREGCRRQPQWTNAQIVEHQAQAHPPK